MLVSVRPLIIISSFISTAYSAVSTTVVMNQLCQRYQREITVLEIGALKSASIFALAKNYAGTYVLMDKQLMYDEEKLENVRFKNIVLLHPSYIDSALLHNLGKCEHFDIVLVRDLEQWAVPTAQAALQGVLTLGDHIFIELSNDLLPTAQTLHACEVAPLNAEKSLCYFAMHKTYITKPRWTSNEESLTNYGIVSNFSEKRMDKQSTNTSSKWIPGVNLLTFLLLKGVYPTDKMMRKQLKTFKHINHNDLVLGNIVVQGRNITPIDFQDTRRNVDPAICIKAALKKVIRDGRLKRDPETMLHKYSEYLQHHKRRMRS